MTHLQEYTREFNTHIDHSLVAQLYRLCFANAMIAAPDTKGIWFSEGGKVWYIVYHT